MPQQSRSPLHDRKRELAELELLNRTSRSVTLTAAGEELQTAILKPFDDIGRAVDVVNKFRDAPVGRIRLSVPTEAAALLVGPVLATFIERYPDVEFEISVSNRMIDVIDSGFDGGIRYGGTVPEDMIAQRLSADIRWVVVAAPMYLERFGTPEHPTDLKTNRCVRIRSGDERIYRWEFERGDEKLEVDVPGCLIIDQGQIGLVAVKGGAGLLYVPEPFVRDLLDVGVLRIVLADWAPLGSGLHLYYSSRRHVPAGLKLFLELVRELRQLG